MLLVLLVAISSTTFLASAVLAAKHQHVALGGYVLAFVAGLILAACNGWMVYKAGGLLGRRTASVPTSRQEWFGKAFVLIIMLWTPCAAFLGNWVALALLHFVA